MKDNRYKLSFCVEIGGENLDSDRAVDYITDAKRMLEEFGCTKFEFQFRDDDGSGYYRGGRLTGFREETQ